jgi:hypothetical protein
MEPEPLTDPRLQSSERSKQEADAWAAREQKRRQEWAAGPTAEEKQRWAWRCARRAAFGLEESRLGPTSEEIEAWAGREQKRRQAWLAGPTDGEKQDWARGRRWRAAIGLAESPLPPSPDEVERWAERETARRREWLAGPSEQERREGPYGPMASFDSAGGSDLAQTASRLVREAELAGKGSLYALSRAPFMLWSYFVRAGREFEKEFYQQPRRGRVPY